MFQVALLESLRKSGVLSEDQIRGVNSFNDIYTLLISTGKIPPFSDEELKVCETVDKIMKDKSCSFSIKIDKIERLSLNVKDETTRGVLDQVVSLGRKL